MLTKKEHTEIMGEYVIYNTARIARFVVCVKEKASGNMVNISLPEARAIHAELTELFKLLDEKV